MAKLRIDLRQGILEAEGDEAFIQTLYDDFKGRLSEKLGQTEIEEDQAENPTEEPAANKKPRKAKPARKESYSVNKDLDVYGKAGHKSLQAFYDEKQPASAVERNAVFVYYLKHILQKEGVNLSDIYTCYKAVGVPAPGSFRQSVFDTSGSRYGWIDGNDMENITVPLAGEQYVEHQLPHKSKVTSPRAAAKE